MVLTEREMNRAAEAWIEDIINACTKDIHRKTYKVVYKETPKVDIKSLPIEIRERLCNCTTEELNRTIPLVPKGKSTQTRKTFVKMVNKFNNMKKKGELTNCTQKLNPIDQL